MVRGCNLTMLAANSTKLKRILNEHEEYAPLKAMPADSISALALPLGQLSSMNQPFASFGGRKPETRSDFNQRIAQRLSHKDRPVCLHDYQSMILQHFKEVYSVNVVPVKNPEQLGSKYLNISLTPVVEQQNYTNKY